VHEHALLRDPSAASHGTIVTIAAARVTKNAPRPRRSGHDSLDPDVHTAQRRRGRAGGARRGWNVRCTDTEVKASITMTEATSRWDDLRRIADEMQLKMHLAEMDTRDRWRELEPQLAEIEHKLAEAGGTASAAMAHELAGLRHLSGDLAMRLRGNYLKGW
jgi:hypothetical protein